MSIEHMDNFSVYGTSTVSKTHMLEGVYAQLGGFGNNSLVLASPDGAGTAFRYYGDGGVDIGQLRYVLQTANDTIGMAGRYWLGSIPSNAAYRTGIAEIRNASNVRIARVYVGTVGNIVAEVGGVIVGDTVGPVLTASAYYHIETKFVRDAAAGTIEVRVEGVPKLVVTGLTMGGVPIAQVAWTSSGSGSNSSPDIYLKDLMIWNGAGAEVNNFQGSCIIYSLIPDADVDLNWTPSTGATGYNLINESTPVDTSYIEAGDPPPNPYRCSLTNLPVDVTSIRALMSIVRAKKIDGGDGNLQVGFVSTTDVELGEDRPITAAYTYWRDFSENDPDTGQPWLPSAVDALELQLNRTV